MSSRERILQTIKNNSPKEAPLPLVDFDVSFADVVGKFKAVLTSIGGVVVDVNNWNEITYYVENNFSHTDRVISPIAELNHEKYNVGFDPHILENVKLAILRGHFAVAESGAVWLTEKNMGDRALPFITEHLALVIDKRDILPTLHDAYDRIAAADYELGTFIAGPSKTADIEQSLVLGAHGARSLVVFLHGGLA